MQKTLSIAHRGGLAYAPENTLAAIKNAIRFEADYAEIDVHLSKDGEIIVIHDEELDRTTNGTGTVREMTVNELNRLDAGCWFSYEFEGEKIPTLEEVLDLAKGKIKLVIEIKNGPNYYEGIARKVVELVKQKKMAKRVIIISFDHECIKEVHDIDPSIETGLLYYGNILDMKNLAETTGAKYMCPCWKMVTQDTVKRAKEAGLKLNVWTLDEPDMIRKFMDMGVDCISTNMPDVLIREISEYKWD